MTTPCPDFDDLSRFVDGELADARRDAVEAHLAVCARCTTLAQRLGVGFGVALQSHNGGPVGSACADTESLVGYVADALPRDVRRDLEQHLRSCDRCVQSVAIMHRRLRLAPEVATPIPPPVRARARAMTRPAMVGRRQRSLGEWLSALGDQLAALVKLPVLVPVAVAAGAVLLLATQQTWWQPGREMLRGTQVERSLRVSAREAPVRTQPTTRAEVVATLTRGSVVTLRAQERDWYRVTLPDGRGGWIEREAFE